MKNVLFFEMFFSKLRMHKNNCSKENTLQAVQTLMQDQ